MQFLCGNRILFYGLPLLYVLGYYKGFKDYYPS